MNDFAESKITVKKDELLLAIKGNLATHRETFLKAQEGYRAAVIAELDKMLADARDGKKLRVAVGLVAPEDHTKDYERVVRMLEMSTASEISISEHQFAQYVLDEWGWKGKFALDTQRYLGG